jgi:Xaa-Pro aminopeptidase
MDRLKRFRDKMAATELDGFVLTNIYNVRYLSGFSGSTAAMFLTLEDAMLITDFRYDEQANSEAYEGVQVRIDKRDALTAVGDMVEVFAGKMGFESDSLPFMSYEKLNARADGRLVAVEGMPEKLRAVKDEEEIAWIAEAARLTDQVFSLITGELAPGMSEVEAAARVDYLLMTAAGDLPAFRTIVAAGERGALPHAHPSGRKLAEGDLVTLDFGAVHGGYCADMTRTVMIGDPTDKQREIYDVVLSAQKTAIDGIKAGITGKEADSLARDYIAGKGYGDQFGHGLGHGLGLEVHEGPRLAQKNEDVLLPGMVVTVEPGVYIPGWGGVRIEDNVVIEEGGCRNLTSSEKKLIKAGD